MRLLFDQNLSPYLVRRLTTEFPGSVHVRHLGLADATDREVWDRALLDNLTIVTKDADFQGFSGPAPRWIWIRLGNCSRRGCDLSIAGRGSELATGTTQSKVGGAATQAQREGSGARFHRIDSDQVITLSR